MKQEINRRQTGHLNAVVTFVATVDCTWSVPGCAIEFAHDLMVNYFDTKRKAK
jgi:hypothetical protein